MGAGASAGVAAAVSAASASEVSTVLRGIDAPERAKLAAALGGGGEGTPLLRGAQPVPAPQDGPCLNVFRKFNGTCLTLDPPPDASDDLKDVRRRLAALEGVGLWQIKLSCGTHELSGMTLGQALQGSEQDVTVSLLPADVVYQSTVDLGLGSKGLLEVGKVGFPEPRGIDINMMPFVMGDMTSLPVEYHHYRPIIEACPVEETELGKIGFLTIQESFVAEGESQRRPGLHLETPGIVMRKGKVVQADVMWGGPGEVEKDFGTTNWGAKDGRVFGGIYMASTMQHSCRAWDLRLGQPAEVAGPLGDLEHLRELLGPGKLLDASTLYWMTDCTPHESLPLDAGVMRQYFRLVTSSVSVWYEKHSTSNPLGVSPDPRVTRILAHDKFADVARLEEQVTRDADEFWDLAAEGLCCQLEKQRFEESFAAGDFIGDRLTYEDFRRRQEEKHEEMRRRNAEMEEADEDEAHDVEEEEGEEREDAEEEEEGEGDEEEG